MVWLGADDFDEYRRILGCKCLAISFSCIRLAFVIGHLPVVGASRGRVQLKWEAHDGFTWRPAVCDRALAGKTTSCPDVKSINGVEFHCGTSKDVDFRRQCSQSLVLHPKPR